MFRLTPYVLKTLWRNRTRTLLTVSGSAVALFVYCFVGAVWEGFDGLGRRQHAQRTLVVFQANRFCPATSHLPEDYRQTIGRLPGVAGVAPIQVFTNNCRASLDVIVFYGLPPQQLRDVRQLQLTAGDWSRFQQQRDAAVVGRAVAGRRGLDVGDRFTIGKLSVDVVGIFQADQPAEENYIYTHLEFLQRTPGLGAVGTVTQFEVQLAEGANPDAVCAAIDEGFRGGPVPTNTQLKGVFQASTLVDLADLIGMMRYLGYACVGLVLALVATTTVMAVEDRILEHAVLQTIGFSAPRIFGVVMAESVLMSLSGGLIGMAAALGVLAAGDLAVGAEAVSIAIRPSAHLAWTALAVSAGVGILAGVLPAWHAARTEIVAALRQV